MLIYLIGIPLWYILTRSVCKAAKDWDEVRTRVIEAVAWPITFIAAITILFEDTKPPKFL